MCANRSSRHGICSGFGQKVALEDVTGIHRCCHVAALEPARVAMCVVSVVAEFMVGVARVAALKPARVESNPRPFSCTPLVVRSA
jgi:hypothetical protein